MQLRQGVSGISYLICEKNVDHRGVKSKGA